VQVWVNGTASDPTWTIEAEAERLTLQNIPLKPTDELELVLSVQSGSLLSKRDRQLETCRKLLRSFRLDSGVKVRIDEALPQILEDGDRLAPFANVLKDAQLAALRNVLHR
jgi:hypothetical protein